MSAQPILLDTCALVWILKGSPIGEAIAQAHNLDARKDKPLVSVVSVGELLALVRDWNWGERRLAAVQALLREYVIVPIESGVIKERYGELMGFSKKKGLAQGQNDHWIAATASITGAKVVTTDKDFDGLHTHQKVDRTYHDPESILALRVPDPNLPGASKKSNGRKSKKAAS